MSKTWIVVEFIESNSVAEVPHNWIISSDKCVWPNWQSAAKIRNAVASHTPPGDNWETFAIKILKATGIHQQYNYSNSKWQLLHDCMAFLYQ